MSQFQGSLLAETFVFSEWLVESLKMGSISKFLPLSVLFTLGIITTVELASVSKDLVVGTPETKNGNLTVEIVKFVNIISPENASLPVQNATYDDHPITERPPSPLNENKSKSIEKTGLNPNEPTESESLSLQSISPTSSNDSNEEVASVTVTSKPIQVVELTSNIIASNETELAKKGGLNKKANEAKENSIKDKVRPSFQPLLDEILRTDEETVIQNGTTTTTLVLPSRIKSEVHKSPNNNNNLPDFSEKELGKRRLNYWRIRQLLKGGEHYDGKMGQVGIKQNLPSVPAALGQKRTTSSGFSNVEMSIPIRQEPGPTLPKERDDTGSSSKLRTFFNWFSNPFKKENDYERVQQLNAQQAILPLALGYRGDFLFW